MNREPLIFNGPLCAPLAYDPSFKGLWGFSSITLLIVYAMQFSPVFSRWCSHRDLTFVLSARATLQEGICCKKKKFVYITFNYCVNGAIHSSLLIYLRFILIERNHAEEWLWVFKIASKRGKGVFPDSSNFYWLFIYLFILIFIDNIREDWCSPQSGIPKQIWAKRFVW